MFTLLSCQRRNEAWWSLKMELSSVQVLNCVDVQRVALLQKPKREVLRVCVCLKC